VTRSCKFPSMRLQSPATEDPVNAENVICMRGAGELVTTWSHPPPLNSHYAPGSDQVWHSTLPLDAQPRRVAHTPSCTFDRKFLNTKPFPKGLS
jgi:hypothetical protein